MALTFAVISKTEPTLKENMHHIWYVHLQTASLLSNNTNSLHTRTHIHVCSKHFLTCIHLPLGVYTWTHTHTHTCVLKALPYVYTPATRCIHMDIHTHTHTRVLKASLLSNNTNSLHTRTHIHVCSKHFLTCIHLPLGVYTWTHTHTHTYTHKHIHVYCEHFSQATLSQQHPTLPLISFYNSYHFVQAP